MSSCLTLTPLPLLSHQSENHLGIPVWRQRIEIELEQALQKGVSIRQVVSSRCQAIDKLLLKLYQFYQIDKTELALFATGGYGRGELHPYSDVDILLLSPHDIEDKLNHIISPFITKLWDIGIEPAIVVRSVVECHQACQQDITVATSLLEARLIAGNTCLQSLPMQIVTTHWTKIAFYQAKLAEAKTRYLKHNATEYNLEPDIKNAPGGLRDIHVIGWIAKYHYQTIHLQNLSEKTFVTEKEFQQLRKAEDFLWLIRHHLHKVTKRNENRLLFDYQKNVAERLDYQSIEKSHHNVENFMRDYYRVAMSISTLAEMLAQHYYELFIEPNLPKEKRSVQKMINQHFKWVGEHIAVTHDQVFSQYPETILQLFLLMGQLNIKRVQTQTLRLLKISAHDINQAYRDNPVHQQLFLDNLKEQNLLHHRLRTMKRYDVLGKYLPAFAQVTGLMQYDLFHRYTVDTHTLLLLRMLHRFACGLYEDRFPLAGMIYRRINRKEILVLSAIFHDIAKGRGGDHCQLGEIEVINFCSSNGISQADTHLISWLVRHHLLMSSTAQKKDISDPEVVADFAEKVGNVTYLNHLYVLTVADMNATNPQIWNSWRASLMKQLYTQTRRILRADIDAPTNRFDMIASNKQQARQLLQNDADLQAIEQLWEELGDEYFLREIPSDIVWHSKAIMAHEMVYLSQSEQNGLVPPLVILREHQELTLDAIQVFIYTQDQPNLFAVTVAVFDQMNLDVLDARIITATRDFALDSYVLLDRQGTLLTDEYRQQELIERLKQAFLKPTLPKLAQRRIPRQLKHFNVPTKVNFEFNAQAKQHMMTLETLDQPALLARVGQVFLQHNIEVHYARITTLGERAEDIFYITDHNDQPLNQESLMKLQQALIETLKLS